MRAIEGLDGDVPRQAPRREQHRRRLTPPSSHRWRTSHKATPGGGGSGFPLALAAPSAPDRHAGLPLPPYGWSVTIYEFTACDQVADCAAALGGTRSPPPQAGPASMTQVRAGRVEEPWSDWRRAVAAVSERRVAEGRALYTQRSPAELYRGARSSERERYARQASRLGAERPSPDPALK